MWQKSNETNYLFTKVFIFFKHQCYPHQNSSLAQLHTDGDVVTTLVTALEIFNLSSDQLTQWFMKPRGSTIFLSKNLKIKIYSLRGVAKNYFFQTLISSPSKQFPWAATHRWKRCSLFW